jgi:hypothetical protein
MTSDDKGNCAEKKRQQISAVIDVGSKGVCKKEILFVDIK